MSLGHKISSARTLVQAFQKWPADANKIYPSFKDAQIELYEHGKDLPSAETLKLRAASAAHLQEDRYYKKFNVSDDMLHPDGNGTYYATIVREASRGSRKVGVVTAIRESMYGWWK